MSYRVRKALVSSGQVWLGDVPRDWELSRLGKYFEVRNEKVSDTEFPALSVTKNGIVPQLETAAKTDAGDNRKRVRSGDFVINSRSDRKGSSGVSVLDGSVSLISIVLEPRSIHGKFVHHLLRSYPFQEEFYRFGKGIVADLWSTNYAEMKNIIISVPPDEEQTAIAAFLDREAAKIDTLIEKQEQLIKLLEEKRQAVISHAVTKGLNPDVRMKDSGVKWLGEVPEHWNVAKVGHLVRYCTSGSRGWSDFVSDDGDVFVQSGDLTDHLSVDIGNAPRVRPPRNQEAVRTRLETGDVLVCITGAKTGRVALMPRCECAAYVNQHVCLLRLRRSGGLPEYLTYVLSADCGQQHFRAAQYGLKQGLGLEDVTNARVPVPPAAEQDAIVTHVNSLCGKIVNGVEMAQRGIRLLVERRTALISAAVTGKIDVRNAV